ncbi:two-component hybrid sensor and regulator [Limimaricola hongkongensis DSM 17492]|uniref:histidine kinase n=2 Tax=Limimaricola hongkongensis TaxID=278132 RepID=A0A017HFE8_9RHOB|nr:two-component hybrid sensor and regulator [Limimaricola hongkongensis DSM 17492]
MSRRPMAHRINLGGFHAFGQVAQAATRQSRRLILRASVLTLAVALFLGALIYLDYQRTIESGRQRLNHVASLFNQTFLSSLDLATVQMTGVIEELSRRELRGIEDFEGTYGGRLQRIARQSEQIGVIAVVDPGGIVLWSTLPGLIGVDVSDRAYFRNALDLAPGAYTLGKPIIGRPTGASVTPVAWPIANDTQPVRGVIASSLDEDYFEALLADTRYDPDMVIEIASDDGPIAFSSAAGDTPATGARLESRARIRGSDLATSVSVPRASVLAGLAMRSAAFAMISAFLYACAIAAAYIAEKRSLALAEAFERSRTEALRAVQARNQFQAIFQSVEDGIVVFDERGQLENANRRARDLLDVPDTRSAIAMLRPHRPVIGGANGAAAGGARSTVRLGTMKNGQRREIRCRMSRVDHLLGQAYYCLLTDVSAEERLTNTRVQFIESINHELRTPLTSLSGSLNLYLDRFGDTMTPSGRKLIDMAKRNADRLLMLVNDVLTLQAVDHERLVITLGSVSTGEVVAEAVAAMRGYADSFGVRLCIAEDLVDLPIRADERRLQQVLGNLISNAVKYSPRAGTVEIGAMRGDDDTVKIWCRDTGPGIPAHARNSIFERFAQPAHEPTVQATGTGLGLAISRELVSRQGGRLELDTIHVNEPGGKTAHGTTFNVVLPIERGARVEEKVG